MKFVQGWFDGNVINRNQPAGRNSFVAPYPGYEYHIELFFVADLANQKFVAGCLCIDMFSKFATVVPILKKDTGNIAAGIIQCLHEMHEKTEKYPKIIYTDAEPARVSKPMEICYAQKNIKHCITRNRAAFVERFIRTYEAMLYKRIDSIKAKHVTDPHWNNSYFEILLTYDNKLIHSSTKMIPADAFKQGVKANLELRANHNRKFPSIECRR
jgi:hypothetical protein